MEDEQVLGCIWLSETARLAPVRQAALLRACASGDAFLSMSARQAADLCGEMTAAESRRFANKSLRRAEEIARQNRDSGFRQLCFYDADFPKPLRHIPDPPAILYVQGRLPDFSSVPAIAVIGKRRASAYGLQIAEKMGYSLSRAGVVVVSGMAAGCDGAAHRGALKGGCPTVAVLGTPLDRCSPASNAALMRDIAAYGALVTEYPVGRPYTRSDFPRRNRLISGLSLGVVVCEAGRQSGTLQTAQLALDQGRDVFAIPGSVDSPNSEGTNELIASSGAQLVTTPQRVLAEYEGRWSALGLRPCEPSDAFRAAERSVNRKQRPQPVSAPRSAEPEKPEQECAGPPRGESVAAAYASAVPEGPQRTLLAALSAPMQIDELIELSGVPAADALQALTFLEIAGLVRRLPGKRFEKIQ